MIAAPKEHSTALHNTLRRIEALTDRLDRVADPQTREAAHELLGLMLDLHGLALARLVSVVAAVADSAASDALIADPYVCAILLLHGLHPRDAQTRLDQAIADMQPQWQERGFHVDLLGMSAGTARVRLYKNGSSEPVDELCREVAALLSEAAPDLDDIFVEIKVAGAASDLDIDAAAAPALRAN
jgi:hypothetical protein